MSLLFFFSGVEKNRNHLLLARANIRFVLICYSELGNPQYLEEELQTGKFEIVKGVMNEHGIEEATIHRYLG